MKSNNYDLSKYVFAITIGFYFLLWVINPVNKILALSYIFLFILYQYKIKNFRLSLLLTYMSSSIVFTGKSYLIPLVPAGIYPINLFPDGYALVFIISAQTLLAALICIVQIRDMLIDRWKFIKPTPAEFLIYAYSAWFIISDIFGSARPEISLLYSSTVIFIPFIYLFIKRNLSDKFSILLHLISALILVESAIAGFQYFASSPIYKHLESQVNIEYYGHVADEIQFAFRPLGTFGHANEFALWLSFWLSISLAYVYKNRAPWLTFCLPFGLIALVSTLSRSAWIGFAVSVFIMLYLVNKRAKIPPPRLANKYIFPGLVISLALFFLFIFPRLEKSLYTFDEGGGVLRQEQISETLGLIIRHPIFGVGSQMEIIAGRDQNPSGVFGSIALSVHNWYLLTAAEHGLLSLLIFLLFIWWTAKKHFSQLLSLRNFKAIDYQRLGFMGGLVSLLIIGLFQPFIGSALIFTLSGILTPSELEKNHAV